MNYINSGGDGGVMDYVNNGGGGSSSGSNSGNGSMQQQQQQQYQEQFMATMSHMNNTPATTTTPSSGLVFAPGGHVLLQQAQAHAEAQALPLLPSISSVLPPPLPPMSSLNTHPSTSGSTTALYLPSSVGIGHVAGVSSSDNTDSSSSGGSSSGGVMDE